MISAILQLPGTTSHTKMLRCARHDRKTEKYKGSAVKMGARESILQTM